MVFHSMLNFLILTIMLTGMLSTGSSRTIHVPIIPSHTIGDNDTPEQLHLNTDQSLQMLQHFVDQALSSFMAVVANQKFRTVRQSQRERHQKCATRALTVQLDKTSFANLRRRITNRANYTLNSPDGELSIRQITAYLTKTVRQVKKKDITKSKSWRAVIEEIRREAQRIQQQKRALDALTRRAKYITAHEMSPRRPLAMKSLDEFDENEEEEELLRMARQKKAKMSKEDKGVQKAIDLVLSGVKIGMRLMGEKDVENKTIKLLSPRLMSVLPEEEHKSRKSRYKQLKLLSPNIFNLHDQPERVNGNDLMSVIEQATSIRSMKQLVGHNKDIEQLLEFLMEAGGVTDALELMKETKIKNVDLAQLMKRRAKANSEVREDYIDSKYKLEQKYGVFETRKVMIFEQLQQSFTKQQLSEHKQNGYFLMNNEQLKLVYGQRSPYNSTITLQNLLPKNASTIHQEIEENIRTLAMHKAPELRQKDVVLTPLVFIPFVGAGFLTSMPLILSPAVFSPHIGSPAILGPVILSPLAFNPLVLSPRVLAPVIVSPLLAVPVIISPLVMHPFILAPGVWVPFILSPLIGDPFILSPQVMTPVVLSPLVLSPLILTPMVLSPLILSPFVLSPIIWSPQVVTALVLSPYALSPIVSSPLVATSVVASPSVLS